MPDFSSTIPDVHINVSSSFVGSLIQTQREKLFTGLMRLRYASGQNLVFSFLDGIQQKLYRSRQENVEVIPRQSWSSYMDSPDASIGFLDLPLEALRLMRVAYEAPIIAIERTNSSVKDLFNNAEKWMAEPSPSIIHIAGESVNRLYLIAGNSVPILEELVFEGSQTHFSINGSSFPSSLPQAVYQVSRYSSDNNYDVWQEYQLRFAFNPLMHVQITRFSELTGRVLTERLCEQLSTRIRDWGWKINITTNGIANHHYFASLGEAKAAYLEIVRSFNSLASPAIGSRMTNGLARDSLLKLSPYQRTLLQRHIYDLYDSENAATRAGGMQS